MEREEWLKRRKIGSSDAPAIMGVSPWTTRYQLYIQKVEGKERADNDAMKQGRLMEDKARREFELVTGHIIPAKNNVQSSVFDFMTANFDGMSMDGKILVEIKCPGKKDHATALSGKVPEKYFPQCQHQLVVAELDEMFYYSFDSKDGVTLQVYRNEKYVKDLIAKESEFWDMVQNLRPPELTERDYKERQDEEWLAVSDEWIEANKRLKEAEEHEALIRKHLIDLTAGQNSKGNGVAFQRILQKGSVNYKEIPELKNVNLDAFRKEPIVKNVIRLC